MMRNEKEDKDGSLTVPVGKAKNFVLQAIRSILFSRSYKRGIAFSTLFYFLSKGIGFLNIVVIAAIFGATSATDIFFYCTFIIGIVSSFLTALNSSILIPEAMRIKEQRSERESQEFLSFFLFLYVGICLALSVAAAIDPIRTFGVASKFKPEILGENVLVLYCSIPLLIVMTVNALFSDILSSYKLFGLSVAATVLNSTVSILSVLLFHRHFHVLSVVFGALAANVLQMAVSFFLLKKQCHWSFGIRRCFPLGRKLVIDAVIAQIGNFFSMMMAYIPMMLLSMFSAGVLSTLTYGSRIPEFLSQLLIVQFCAITGIKFNELYAHQKEHEIAKTYLDASAFLQFILIPLCIFIGLFSRDIVALLFGRGAFDDRSIGQTAQFMSLLIIALPFIAHNTMVARLFMSAQKIQKSVIFQIIMSCVNVAITAAFIKALGPKGFPLGSLVFYCLNTVAAAVIMNRNFRAISYFGAIAYTVKCLFINIPVAAVVYGASLVCPIRAPWLAAVWFIAYMTMMLALNQVLKINGTVAGYIRMYLGKAAL